MTQPDPGQRLTAALAALCDPTTVRVDRLATTDTDRDAVRATNAEAAANHRDQIAFYRRDLGRYQAQGNDVMVRRVQALIDDREARHAEAVEQRRSAKAVVPSLLERLLDAVHGSGGSNGASGAGAHRSPIGLAAADLLGDIARESACPRGRALDTHLRAWAHEDDPDVAAELLEMWVKTGRAIIEPPKMAELRFPCPVCNTEYVTVIEDGERIRKRAMQVNLTTGVTTCLHPPCGATTPPERAPLLAAALRQDVDERHDARARREL